MRANVKAIAAKAMIPCLYVLAIFLCAAGIAGTAFGQVNQGRIGGLVQDESQGAIVGATVTVMNDRTGEMRTTTTGQDGNFLITALPPSTYTIRVTKDQFTTGEAISVQVTVGQTARREFTLRVATAATSVTVTAGEVAPMDTTSARIGVNVNEREVEGLPINGRQLSQLYLQAPGSLNSGTGTFQDIRFSGRAVEQNAIRYDGVEGSAIVDAAPGNLNGEVPSPFRLQSSLENVQEFRVESNNYPAEYGTGTGGQISVITKSGSNAFHGSVFEYLRNNAVDAKNYFDLDQHKLQLNQFGASFGGRLIRDKFFFYMYYEGYRLQSGVNAVEAAPSAAVRALPVCPPGVVPVDNTTCVSAATKPLLEGFIGPGAVLLPGKSTSPDFDIYQLQSNVRVNENSGGLRLDYHLNNSHSLSARYFRDQGFNSAPEGITGRVSTIQANPQNAMLSLNSLFGANVVNELKFGYNNAYTRIVGNAPTIAGVDYSKIAINITGSVANAGIAGQGSSSGIAVPGGLVRANSATNGHAAPYTPYTLSFIDNVSWVTGSHSLKFGGEVRLVRFYTDRIGGTTYTFQNLTGLLANTPQQVQFLGDLSAPSVFNNGLSGPVNGQQEYYILYGQDEVKLLPSLTLNYGLRYEYYSPMREKDNRVIYFDVFDGTLGCASPAPVCDKPAPDSIYKANATNFGPRVGLAWSPSPSGTGLFGGGHTVIRGGFGIFYGPGQLEDTLQPLESDRIASVVKPGSYPLDEAALSASFINSSQNPTVAPNARAFQPRAYSREYINPERIYQYSVSWQQQWGQFVSTIAYVGSQGRNLFLRNWTNRIISVDPATGTVTREFDIVQGSNILRPYAEIDFKQSGGHDSYNALQMSLVRRMASGLTMSAQYTHSTSRGNSAGSNEAQTSGNPFDYEYDNGYNAFDVRDTFNISALYQLPVGRNQRYLRNLSGIAEHVLGNWQLGTIISARSGVPLNVLITRPDVVWTDSTNRVFQSQANCTSAGGAGCIAVINTPGGGASRNVRRPDLVPGVDPFLSNGFVNPAAFATPAPGTFGNLERFSLHGPAFSQVDFTIAKKFVTSETTSINFRVEFFNLFNHPNFANPPVTLPNVLGTGTNQLQPGQPFTSGAAGSFGKYSSTVGTTVGLGTNRQVQFALRFDF